MAKVCSSCGSTRFIKYGYQVRGKERIRKYLCKACNTYFVNPRWTGSKKSSDTEFNDMGNEVSNEK